METETVTTEGGGYVENPDHVPNPTDAYGTLDTTGTGGGAHAKIEEITPIFDVAKSQDLATAARALDPDDPDVHASLVTLPDGQRIVPVDPEAAADRVRAAAEAATAEPVDLSSSRMTPAKEAAAEETGGEPETETQPDPTAGTGASSTASTEGTNAASEPTGDEAKTAEAKDAAAEKAGRRGQKPE